MTKKTKTNYPNTVHITQHIELQSEQHEPNKKLEVIPCASEGVNIS